MSLRIGWLTPPRSAPLRGCVSRPANIRAEGPFAPSFANGGHQPVGLASPDVHTAGFHAVRPKAARPVTANPCLRLRMTLGRISQHFVVCRIRPIMVSRSIIGKQSLSRATEPSPRPPACTDQRSLARQTLDGPPLPDHVTAQTPQSIGGRSTRTVSGCPASGGNRFRISGS